ncbi:hypothetical protein BDR05DRAFT_889615 [Suillus weaverae]|nr:hypothetical protein BDR05DRAFT_889615 [Suillus weaverae]
MRHASPFHRRQTIEEHFSFWDTDKYTTLSNFIWNHYREVLNSIQMLTAELAVIKAELCLTDEDLVQFLKDERVYLDELKLPPVQDQLCIHYVEVLHELAVESRTFAGLADWDVAWEVGNNALTSIPTGSLEEINNTLALTWICVDSSYVKLQHAEGLARHIETQLAVDQWWEIGGPEYQHFKEEASPGKYHTALDELEHLMVMRLFELSKLSLSGTGKFIYAEIPTLTSIFFLGYKLCKQLGKTLQCHLDAIHNAINCYNTQATALNPPHSKIS